MPPTPPTSTEERCRTAVARLPRATAMTRGLGRGFSRTRRASWLVVLLTPAVLLLGAPFEVVLVALLVLLAVTSVASLTMVRAVADCGRADRHFVEGRTDEAAALYDEVAGRRWLVPAARGVAALSLARAATVAGHGERAVVLLRAIEASGSLPVEHEDAMRTSTALALLTLGRAPEARAVTRSLRAPMPGLELLVEALAGSLEDALRAADAPLAAAEIGHDPGYHALRLRLGWLVRAYVAERVVRAAPGDAERAAAATRRDAALHEAGAVPPWMHAHLHGAWPDFGAFARRVTEPVVAAPPGVAAG